MDGERNYIMVWINSILIIFLLWQLNITQKSLLRLVNILDKRIDSILFPRSKKGNGDAGI